MTNEEILVKAIKKARDNGYEGVSPFVLKTQNWKCAINKFRHFQILFSHDFAKAFFGERKVCNICGEDENFDDTKSFCYICEGKDYGSGYPIFEWKYQLQQMVLEEEPLKYLEKFL